ncbi:C-C motif chemokine 22 [Heterocephalus glaber]|uniref:C-C motif chemokine n=1 Tax=Heterocephalus glaber TaxID=10181 RepID=G5AUE2_HETGA|nr:C-C motif chemokine 22 [Heterocephalus glaber]EHB00653.1 C-C motif chemokine 22 [Heterocephalus glaber]
MAGLQAPLLAGLVFLSVMLQATNAGPYGANVEDSICCRDFVRHPLPLRVVKDFYWTSGSCRRTGIVLQTVKDREICANPKLPWVKKILQKLSS